MRPRIPQRKRIYLGCEGESEQSYGKRLNEIADNAGLHLYIDSDVLQPGGGDPLALVETAIKRIRQKVFSRGPYVSCAVILDADRLKVRHDRDAQIQRLANTHRIHLIWQRPCHEGFLLRHLPNQDTVRPQTSVLALESLKRIWPEYRKGIPASELAPWVNAEALRRAAVVEPDLQTFLALIDLIDKL